MKQEPTEATMRNCHGSAVGILAINGEEDVKSEPDQKRDNGVRRFVPQPQPCLAV
jgi:hypothetical protein